jgi:DNA-binding transcriptional MerR regulator
MTYRISTVSEMTGVPRNTLIAWERRYGFIRPERHENGYRSYSEADVENLLRIQNALGAGLKISEAIALLKDQQSAEPVHAPAADPLRDLSSEADALVRRLTDALVSYRAKDAERILAQFGGMPFEERLHQVFFPVLERVGNLWEAGQINVAQEHYASAIIRDQLVSILIAVGTRSAHEPHAACATFPGELHELPALALGVHLGLRGFRVSYLGANLPLFDLVDFCAKQRPELICVSVLGSFAPRDIEDYGRGLRAGAAAGARVVIGGTGVTHEPPLSTPGVEYIPRWQDFRL